MSGSSHTSGSGMGTRDQVFFGLPDVYVDKGAHVAHFFQGDQERVNVLTPFLRAGLESGDQCVLVAETSASPNISDSLKELGGRRGGPGLRPTAGIRRGFQQRRDVFHVLPGP